uniref:Uncharacterized protein n=2 Tax=Lutzomyia longipalpis TaxID=7200 RepID=A0A1B0GHG4_LUTLO
MHSSQQPAERPPLTKGLTVDGMVKRLSMERFSPPPQLTGPAFSYTRPKEQIIYAQVVCDGDKAKQTVHYAPSHLNGFHSDTNGRRNGRPSQSPSPYRDDKSPLHINGDRLQRKETPRVNSDEDEGLGFEIKRPYEEDFRTLVDEGPITPKIRDVPPEKYYLGDRTPAFQDLSQRRQNLQSRINNRLFGSKELLEDTSPERDVFARNGHQNVFEESRYQRSKSHDIDHVDNAKRYHKFGSQEVVNRYSPDRSHLDMTQTPSNGRITSKYVEESRYYHDGRDGYRETYRRETNIGPDGRPRTSESRSKERLNSPKRGAKEIDLGYIEDHRNFDVGHLEPNTSYFQEKYRNDLHQPRSLESTTSGDVTRSSPDQAFRQHLKSTHLANGYRHESVDSYQNSLKRQQKHQRSFDKGDSGIENDYRKDSFNGDLQTRKERRHTEDNHPVRRRLTYAYRERSIDDGSHFDPRLDKYPDGTTRKSRDSREKSVEKSGKVEKKKSGLEKVKQLLTGSGKKKSTKEEKAKEKYMVKEEEMRARYSEYRGPTEGPKIQDIATRRRLSTPKASPVPRRTSSQKSTSKSSSNLSQQENTPSQKLSWFKSLDRLSRKNKVTTSRKTASDDDFSSIQSPRPRPLSPRQENQAPTKNLRFFGDTDLESNASISKGALKSNSSLQHLEDGFLFNGRTKTQSRDLHDISESASDNENRPIRHASRSVPAKPSRGRHSSESTGTSIIKSTTLNRRTPNGVAVNSSHDEDVESEIPFQRKRHYFEEVSRRHESPARTHPTLRRELSFGGTGSNDYRKPPPGPQKPARLFEKRRAYSRERERLHDSFGTEGDSSQQSQRSVVYLHATTVGDIPQPMRRRAASRDDLSSNKSKGQRPMTRTVSRSVSVLAPKARSSSLQHLEDGFLFNGRTKTQSRDLHDISESASDNENRPIRHASRSVPAKPSRGRHSSESTGTSIIKSTTLNRRTPNGVAVNSSHDEDVESEIPFQRKRHYFEEVSRRHESPARTHPTLRRELSFGGTGSNDYRKPPPGPQKPARLFEKRRAYSRERERLHDSSGTEGDSSQQSQRSVVYLHATTVGDIPQPMRRRAASRDDLSSNKSKGQRPMTRTVSRSVSVLAPWKPKHLHEGYEINYSQTQEKPRKFYHQERKSPAASSTLNTKRDTTTLTRYKKATPRDEMSSDKSSSFKSSSNLGFFTQSRQARNHKRDSEPRNLSEISLTRRRDTPERFPATRRRWND